MIAPTPRRTPSVKPGDVRYVCERLARETGYLQKDCERIYQENGCNFNRAKAQIEREQRCERERQEEREFQQILLTMQYDAQILPAIQQWSRDTFHGFDPLRNPSHAYHFIEEMIERGVIVNPDPEPNHTISVRITYRKKGWFGSGRGIGDTLREAAVLAWWNCFGEQYQ